MRRRFLNQETHDQLRIDLAIDPTEDEEAVVGQVLAWSFFRLTLERTRGERLKGGRSETGELIPVDVPRLVLHLHCPVRPLLANSNRMIFKPSIVHEAPVSTVFFFA